MILLPESIFSNKVKIGRREYGLVKRVGVTVFNKKTQDTFIETRSGKASRKKVAVLLDVVQMRVGGRPLPKFFGTLAFKISGTSCLNLREGGGNLDKIQGKMTLFS